MSNAMHPKNTNPRKRIHTEAGRSGSIETERGNFSTLLQRPNGTANPTFASAFDDYNEQVISRLTAIASNELAARLMDAARLRGEPPDSDFLGCRRIPTGQTLRALYRDRATGRIRAFAYNCNGIGCSTVR